MMYIFPGSRYCKGLRRRDQGQLQLLRRPGLHQVQPLRLGKLQETWEHLHRLLQRRHHLQDHTPRRRRRHAEAAASGV